MTENVTPPLEKIVRLVGKAIGSFKMLRSGDHVAIGLSGGKDSTTLLHALLALQRRAPIRFYLHAFTIQQGKFLGSLDGLKRHLAELGVPWILVEDRPSLNLIRDSVAHGCDICSRYRRRAVYDVARSLGCNVVAFGHTADDFAEAIIRNLVFTGAAKPLPPTALSSGGEFRIIRPLLYVNERLILKYASDDPFPITPCACSLKEGARTKVRGFLQSLSNDNPHIYSNLVSAGIATWKAKSPRSGTATTEVGNIELGHAELHQL